MPHVVPHALVRAHLEDLVQLLERDVVERALVVLARGGEFCFRDEEVDEDERERAEAREDADEGRLPREPGGVVGGAGGGGGGRGGEGVRARGDLGAGDEEG